MDDALAISVIERDWADFTAQSARLGLGVPTRNGIEIFLPLRPAGTNEQFLAVLRCDDYDVVAPLLDFADRHTPTARGAAHWPKMRDAPMNTISIGSVTLPIVCTPGTRGYHLHQSHNAEQHPRSTWRLPAVASVLWRLAQRMGPYEGRGV